MSVFAVQHHQLEERFNAQITLGGDGGSPVTTRFANDPSDPPTSGPWCRVTVRQANRDRAEIGQAAGSPLHRTTGAVFVECFVDHGVGSQAGLALADRVREAFQAQTITSGSNSITLRAPYLQNGSAGDRQGPWWRLTVVCPFFADDME